MCTNRSRVINPYTRKSLVVDCGKCPACLQSRAIHRTSKIKNQSSSDFDIFFVTLTYAPQFVPYIYEQDVKFVALDCRDGQLFEHHPYCVADRTPSIYNRFCASSHKFYRRLPVRRDFSARFIRDNKDYSTSRVVVPLADNKIDEIEIDANLQYLEEYKKLCISNEGGKRTFSPTRIGIKYYKDVQQFIKNLRHHLKRDFSYEDRFHYFCCSEYGTDSARPHFHLLLFVPRFPKSYEVFESAVASAWPYDCDDVKGGRFQRAINAASYVSSYVNCITSLPRLFSANRSLSPQCSHSFHFGFAKDVFSIDAVYAAIRRADIRYYQERTRNGVIVNVSCIFPKYIIHRYFPKLLGHCWLNDNEAFSIYERPSLTYSYQSKCSLTRHQARKQVTFLRNKQSYAHDHGISSVDFASACVDVWRLFPSEILRDFYSNSFNLKKPLQAYDNIIDFYSTDVLAPTLEPFVQVTDHFITDFNEFDSVKARTSNLLMWFDVYNKNHKVRNHIYSKNHISF